MATDSALSALLATFDSSIPALSLFELGRDAAVAGPSVDGVAAFLVLRGRLQLERADSTPLAVSAGRLVLVPPGVPATLASSRRRRGAPFGWKNAVVRRGRWIVADATGGQEPTVSVAAARIAGSALCGLQGTRVLALDRCAIARPLVSLLQAECLRRGSPALAAALMNACVIQGLRLGIAAGSSSTAARPSLVDRAVTAMRNRPADAHTIESLAGVAGMSRSTFLRHFRRATSTAPAAFLLRVRLEEARALLATTNLSVKAVAAATGFADRSHFSRAFTREFGRNPSQSSKDEAAL